MKGKVRTANHVPNPSLAHCRSCGAPVLCYQHERTGTAMQINASPETEGNIVLDPSRGTWRLAELFDEGDRFVSHFATCPQADQWRKKGTNAAKREAAL